MSGIVDFLILVLLAVLVVFEILRPRRVRGLLDEVDRRTEAATAALDSAQRRLEGAVQELAVERSRQEREGRQEGSEPETAERERPAPATRRRASAAARYRREAEGGTSGPGERPDEDESEEVRSLREEVAARLERSSSGRSHRERRLLGELQDILDMDAGPDRDSREKSLYEALQRAMEEPAPRRPSSVPEEEHELIEKLRRNA
ncbi:hypothetical protein [Thiohalorhabdus methylotrophus]|uniref:Uncharacterized protein n=1 Tax=Thiohalorhabdus methylotrophus TaxID=3242694 RepID=A0ABV4TY28_9GAMM